MQKIVSTIIFMIIMGFLDRGDAQETTPEDHFLRAKKLIEANCGDCMGGTKKGLEEGIAELRKAIQLGYKNKEAYKLLAEAYNEIVIVYSVRGSAEQKSLIDEKKKIYRQLYELDPNDPEILYLYAELFEDDREKLAMYRKLLERDPKHSDARFVMGLLLIKKGQLKQGANEIKEAILLEQNVLVLNNYISRLIESLNQHGCKLEFQESEDLFKLENDIQAIENHKMKFIKILDEQKCY